MITPLALGDHGTRVSALQDKLRAAGFPVADPPSLFLDGTEAAVINYQLSEGLLADGVVGRKTAESLGLADLPDGPVLSIFTVELVVKMFFDARRSNVETYLPKVLAALSQHGLSSHLVVLGALATIRAETAGFVPISEGVSKFNTVHNAFDLYDFRKDLGNGAKGDGAKFKGRGFVQLTGKANYAKYGPPLGIDLVANPDQANEADTAANLLALFIKNCETPFKQALVHGDFATARRCVNGGHHGLPDFTTAYQTGSKLLVA